jgi:XTP/dITP diphosphohydrolase
MSLLTKQLLVATANLHKKEEFQRLLPNLPLTSFKEHPPIKEIIEDADTFEGNAIIKAVQAFEETGIMTLADDSGLEVDALNGAPGVYSARYTSGSDLDRVLFLLKNMADKSNRTARFRCVLILAGAPDPKTLGVEADLDADLRWENQLYIAQASVEGEIGHALKGRQGFGYDPIFYIDPKVYFPHDLSLQNDANLLKSIAELPSSQKDQISHRGRAVQKIFKILKKIFDNP